MADVKDLIAAAGALAELLFISRQALVKAGFSLNEANYIIAVSFSDALNNKPKKD